MSSSAKRRHAALLRSAASPGLHGVGRGGFASSALPALSTPSAAAPLTAATDSRRVHGLGPPPLDPAAPLFPVLGGQERPQGSPRVGASARSHDGAIPAGNNQVPA